jgi:hypothetical protein
MLDSALQDARPDKTASALYTFRMRHAPLSQAALGKLFGLDQRWVSAREVNPRLEEVWIPSHLEKLEREFKSKHREADDIPRCPECDVPMKLGKKYLKHWCYGKLKNRVVCQGQAGRSHPRILMGQLDTGQWQRLDRVRNPRTKQEVVLRDRKKITQYERAHGFVWCDCCGGICTPQGLYSFHRGAPFHIFRCFARDCEFGGYGKGGKRLYCRNGQSYEGRAIPSSARMSSLPEEAKCFYCKGPVHSRGTQQAPPNQVQLYCKDCGKISYWHLIEKVVLPGRPSGGVPVNDPHRPTCRKCAKRNKRVTRCSFTRAGFEKRPTLLPVPVRIRIQKWAWLRQLFQEAKPSEIFLREYACPHQKTYKTADGRIVWSRKKGVRLRKGMTLAFALLHREGRPVLQS